MKADEILKPLDFTIRPAEHSDSKNIWAGRNDNETRRNSNSDDQIAWENHSL